MKHQISALVTCALFFASSPEASACTGILVHTEDGSIVHGRTVEVGITSDTAIVFVPRGHEFTAQTPRGTGLRYSARYASLGTIAFADVKIMDGLNEKGLAVGAFYFPTFAEYTPVTAENQARALSPGDFPNWLLTQFASVDEVREAIEAEAVIIAPTVMKGWGPEAPPFHWVVHDRSGKSLVIEPVGGKLVLHDNPIGVLTNSPTFDWHMTNLRNYIALDPRNVPPVEVAGETFKQLGQGSGMLGLPGDFSPPSRFVRAAVFSATAVPARDREAGIAQVFHILNNFDIPVGVARQKTDGVIHTDYTMLTVARDPQSLTYYYKSYEDQTLRMVRMKQFDLDSEGVRLLSTRGEQTIVDMTAELNTNSAQ